VCLYVCALVYYGAYDVCTRARMYTVGGQGSSKTMESRIAALEDKDGILIIVGNQSKPFRKCLLRSSSTHTHTHINIHTIHDEYEV
jgi:hypothetical protein